MTFLRAIVALLGLAYVLTPPSAGAANPNALWHVVHDLCRVDMKISHLAAPCLEYDRRGGFAALKDLKGKTQVLMIPTARVTGIESPKLLAPGGPNYWQAAWDARRFFEKRAGQEVPREDIGLAINSMFGRSQNQLHIHVDCVSAEVKAALAAHGREIGPRWKAFEIDLAGERYRARRIEGAEIAPHDPFKLLARESGEVHADMGRQTLVVVGATLKDGRPGFILLAAAGGTVRNPQGAGEDLLDHDCAVLRETAVTPLP
ncbi:MAG TPA: CDP-diacylglycerol diphosphatase [Caulobacteraceae bacterium]